MAMDTQCSNFHWPVMNLDWNAFLSSPPDVTEGPTTVTTFFTARNCRRFCPRVLPMAHSWPMNHQPPPPPAFGAGLFPAGPGTSRGRCRRMPRTWTWSCRCGGRRGPAERRSAPQRIQPASRTPGGPCRAAPLGDIWEGRAGLSGGSFFNEPQKN